MTHPRQDELTWWLSLEGDLYARIDHEGAVIIMQGTGKPGSCCRSTGPAHTWEQVLQQRSYIVMHRPSANGHMDRWARRLTLDQVLHNGYGHTAFFTPLINVVSGSAQEGDECMVSLDLSRASTSRVEPVFSLACPPALRGRPVAGVLAPDKQAQATTCPSSLVTAFAFTRADTQAISIPTVAQYAAAWEECIRAISHPSARETALATGRPAELLLQRCQEASVLPVLPGVPGVPENSGRCLLLARILQEALDQVQPDQSIMQRHLMVNNTDTANAKSTQCQRKALQRIAVTLGMQQARRVSAWHAEWQAQVGLTNDDARALDLLSMALSPAQQADFWVQHSIPWGDDSFKQLTRALRLQFKQGPMAAWHQHFRPAIVALIIRQGGDDTGLINATLDALQAATVPLADELAWEGQDDVRTHIASFEQHRTNALQIGMAGYSAQVVHQTLQNNWHCRA